MTIEWRSIDTPMPDGSDPKDHRLILRGTIDRTTLSEDEDTWFPRGMVRCFGYWDTIDDAWALETTPWYGPFFFPTHYAVIPPELRLY